MKPTFLCNLSERGKADSARLAVLQAETDETMAETRRILMPCRGDERSDISVIPSDRPDWLEFETSDEHAERCRRERNRPDMLRSIRQQSPQNQQANGLAIARFHDVARGLVCAGLSKQAVADSLRCVAEELLRKDS